MWIHRWWKGIGTSIWVISVLSLRLPFCFVLVSWHRRHLERSTRSRMRLESKLTMKFGRFFWGGKRVPEWGWNVIFFWFFFYGYVEVLIQVLHGYFKPGDGKMAQDGQNQLLPGWGFFHENSRLVELVPSQNHIDRGVPWMFNRHWFMIGPIGSHHHSKLLKTHWSVDQFSKLPESDSIFQTVWPPARLQP